MDFKTANGYILYFSDRRGMQFTNPDGRESVAGAMGRIRL